MAKPSITFRAVKGSPLTTAELDTNFQNIIDSILTVTDGVNDADLELIDTLEITGDHNIKITVDGAGKIVTVDNEIPTYTKEPMGFENRTDSTISFTEGTRTFTIQPAVTNFRVWCSGVEYVKSSAETIVIDDVTDLYFIYYDTDGVLSVEIDYFTFSNETPVAYVYWNATTSKAYYFADERHGIVLDWQTHEYLHRTRGAAYANGLAISNYTISGSGSADSDAQFDLSQGTIFDEDIRIEITHSNTPTANTWQQDLQGPARIPVFYHSGATGAWVLDTATDFAVKAGSSLIAYNLNTSGTWTTPDAGNNSYVAYWIVATNALNTPVISIMGQRTDVNIGNAQDNNTWNSLDLTNFPSLEFRPLYRIIFQTGSYGNTVNARIRDVLDYRTVNILAPGIVTTGGAGTSADGFANIAVSGQSTIVADAPAATVTFAAGTGISLTTDAGTDTLTITNTGSAPNVFANIAVSGQDTIAADSATDTLTIVAGTNITLTTDSSTDTLTVTGPPVPITIPNTDSIAMGTNAGSGSYGVAIGVDATATFSGIAIGYQAGGSGGANEIAIGRQAGQNVTSNGDSNIMIGYGTTAQSGDSNIFLGNQIQGGTDTAGSIVIGGGVDLQGGSNIFIGNGVAGSLPSDVTGSGNIVIGHFANPSGTTAVNEITLGSASADKFRIPGLGFSIDTTSIKTFVTSGTPTNYENAYFEDMLQAPVTWLKITVGGTDYYLPLFQ